MKYDINLCDEYGLYQSGTAEHDGMVEPLTYWPHTNNYYDSFKVQEASCTISDYPVRWYHMYGDDYYNLAICAWMPRVEEITFHNNAKKDVELTVSGMRAAMIPVGGSFTVKWSGY